MFKYIGRKRFKRFMEILLIIILLIVIAGCIYQKIGIYNDNQKYPPVGKMIEVDGHNMHIYSKGRGKVTVIFTSGSGVSSPYADMFPLYNEISKFTRIVIYDRPGYGWSEQTQNSRDIDTVVKELHILLEKSGEKPPYILVGHSMGSLEVLRFTQIYKDEVTGIVLVDGAAPIYCSDFKDSMGAAPYILQFIKNVGLLRALSNTNSINKMINQNNSISNELKKINTALTLKNLWDKNMIEERKVLNANGKIVIQGGNLGETPITIITAGSNGFANWNNTQKSLLNLSKNTKQIYLKNSGHFIQYEQPNVVNKEIKELIDKIN